MLEPFLRPKAGIGLHATVAGLALLLLVFSFSFGTLELGLILPFVTAFSILRIAGILAAERHGAREMAWTWRAGSWGALALGVLVMGAIASPVAIVLLLAFMLLDTAGALSKRRPGESAPKAAKARKKPSGTWQRIRGTVLAVVLIGLFAAWHFLFAIHQTWTALADWGAVAVLVAIYLRIALVSGKRAKEDAARPPVKHRLHTPRERVIADPARASLERGIESFLKDGDVETLTWSARAIAATRGLPPEAAQALEARLVEILTRPRTKRDRDLADAIEMLESASLAPALPGATAWRPPATAVSTDAVVFQRPPERSGRATPGAFGNP